jgi:glycosyltransferase 2 family protein
MTYSLLFKALISIALIGYLVATQDFTDAFGLFLRTNQWLFALGLLIALSVQCLGAWRWQLLAAPVGVTLNFKESFKYFMLGNFFSLFVPGSVGGDVGRLVYIARRCEKPRLLVGLTLGVEKGLGLLGILLLTSLALFFAEQTEMVRTLYWPVVLLVAFSVLGIFVAKLPLVQKVLSRYDGSNFLSKLQEYQDTNLLVSSLLLAVLSHALLVLIHILIASALSIPIGWIELTWIYGVVSLAVVLPISFNGIGIREGGYVLLLGTAGVQAEAAMSFALYWFCILLLINVMGGIPLLLEKKEKLPVKKVSVVLEPEATDRLAEQRYHV